MSERFAAMRSLPTLAATSLGAAFDWWRAELFAMVPAALRARFGLIRPVLQASLDAGLLVLLVNDGKQNRQVYRGPADSSDAMRALASLQQRRNARRMDVELLLDSADVLVRRIELPAAVRHRVADALKFELSRHTPFNPDDVYMYWQAGEPQNDRLPVTLAVVARDHVATLAERLRATGLIPTFARGAGDIRFKVAGVSAPRWSTIISTALAGSVALLCMLLANVELVRQEDLLAQINAELGRERRNAVEVEKWRGELAQAEKRQRFFGERLVDKRISVALHSLSRDLPDNVWLQQMTLQNGEIRLYGYAPEPATVINMLEASGQFENARFRSPSTRRGGASVDRFDISAQIKKGGGS